MTQKPRDSRMEPADPRQALKRAEADKTLTMERSVARIRAIVVGLNVVSFLAFVGLDQPRAPLALAIIISASAYAIWSLAARPYERYPLLRFGAATLVTDTVLITLWVLATGGPRSEFWVIYIVSVISVAMRYDVGQTVATAAAQAAVYTSAMLLDGSGFDLAIVVRAGYIMICSYAAGVLARQERISRQERVAFERLADDHARLLERERETVERLRELDRLRSEFVASASHELRTPLTTIIGFSSMISSRYHEMSPEDLAMALEAMQRQGERVASLVKNLLDLSQLENERMRLDLAPVSLAQTAHRVLEVARPPEDRSVEVRINDDLTVVADRVRLEQVLTNLLVNAYRYGGRSVQLQATARHDCVTIDVTDDGPGVPSDLVPHLFEPFSRGADTASVSGSGLGLAISRRLVEALGGELRYEPASPRGARFTVRLPVAA